MSAQSILNRANSPALAIKEKSTARPTSPDNKRKVRKIKNADIIDAQFIVGSVDG